MTSVLAQWPQWGGPDRDFKSNATGLADAWPDAGPPQVWSRELGEGYSAISVDSGTLYTMYRSGDDEKIVALAAADGKTRWEHTTAAPTEKGMRMGFGPGPHCTPLIVGKRLFAVGILGAFHCLDKQTAKQLWSHDLKKEYDARQLPRGYACSPIAYKDMVILTGGGDGHAIMAFKQDSGELVWHSQTYVSTYSSPILIEFGGRPQLVAFMGAELVGLDPDTGKLLWSHPHPTNMFVNVCTPCWNGKDILFCSSAYNMGARAIRLKMVGDKFETEELWYNKKFQIHHGNALIIGNYVYGSSGSFGPAFYMAVNLGTGEIVWRKRGFAKATSLLADGKVIFLDQDGRLVLAKLSPEEMTVLSEFQLFDERSWTVPTLVGKRLYARDRKRIVALDLG